MEVIQINAKFVEDSLYLSSNHFANVLIEVGSDIDDFEIEELKAKPGTCRIKFNLDKYSSSNIKHREFEFTSMSDFITKLRENDIFSGNIFDALIACCDFEMNGKPLNMED